MLLNNPDFYNCSIAFEPYHFKNKGRYFSAYTKYDGDSTRTIQGGNDNYQYFYMDWYLMPMLSERPCWTEPYMDYDTYSNTTEMVTSYCQTINDREGRKIGVINTSLSLNWLSQTISNDRTWRHLYCTPGHKQDYTSVHLYSDYRAPRHSDVCFGTCHAARRGGHEAHAH